MKHRLLYSNLRHYNYCSVVKRCLQQAKILGIETSCDDTGLAIVTTEGQILGECVKSQQSFSTRFGGVIPMFACTQHKANLQPALQETLQQASLTMNDIDAIAVTVKPGLVICLHEGVTFAMDLCRRFKKPMIPIHHMQAHALTVRLTDHDVQFPYMCLLISGGHSLIVWVRSIDRFEILGRNLDSAPGDVFDKVSRRLLLAHIDSTTTSMSGGALIQRGAEGGRYDTIEFTVPNTKMTDCSFSFSGLASQALAKIEHEEKRLGLNGTTLLPNYKDFCASFQHAIFRHIGRSVMRAFEYIKATTTVDQDDDDSELDEYLGYPKTLVISGGVAANEYIRNGLAYVSSQYKCRLICPPQKYCTDNGVMIAWNGAEKWLKNEDIFHNIPSSYYLEPKCQIGEDVTQEVRRLGLTRKVMNRCHVKCNFMQDFSKQSDDFSTTENLSLKNECF